MREIEIVVGLVLLMFMGGMLDAPPPLRERIRRYVRTLADLRAGDPAYAETVAPGETIERQREMQRMSGCALVAASVLRFAGVTDPRLAAPYETGTAVSRLVAIARARGAWRSPKGDELPDVGDIVVVGVEAGKGPEHVFTIVQKNANRLQSIDGGQVTESGVQTIRQVDRVAEWRADGLYIGRKVYGWIDAEAIAGSEPIA